jgi:hypothetical protein
MLASIHCVGVLALSVAVARQPTAAFDRFSFAESTTADYFRFAQVYGDWVTYDGWVTARSLVFFFKLRTFCLRNNDRGESKLRLQATS